MRASEVLGETPGASRVLVDSQGLGSRDSREVVREGVLGARGVAGLATRAGMVCGAVRRTRFLQIEQLMSNTWYPVPSRRRENSLQIGTLPS